ncbi:MAG: MBL fold metallo-hydrolase [Prevotellaceae bacterium]|jgi:glyoxylase-like metal-dependent hydrolase (beta-lactamase superfamily II)|nr:MBL fold metallo-hydrolase [Prevotellaceae bacterium]
MKIKQFTFNPVQLNTFVAYDETQECVIIDAGCFFPGEEKALSDFIEKENLKPVRLLNTHGHFDHVFGVNFVQKKYNLTHEGNAADNVWIEQMPARASVFGFTDIQPIESMPKPLKEGDVVIFGNSKLEVLEVPGHSAGSLVYYSAADKILFAGDVLFRGSIGRTDLPQGDYGTLIRNIRQKLFTLPPETIVYPGHGEPTTIGWEKAHNPFF